MASSSNLATMLPAHLYQRPSFSLWFNPSQQRPFEPLPDMVPANFPSLFRRIPTSLERSMPVRSLLGDFRPSRFRPIALTGGAPPSGPIVHPAYTPPEPLASIPITFAPAPPASPQVPTGITRRFYRPPLSGGGLKELVEILNPTVHRDTVCSPLVEAAAGPLSDSLQLHPYDIPQEPAKFLQNCGIQASGCGYKNAARTLDDCGFAATTIASSQGSTYDHPACIDLDKNSSQLSHAHSLVTLTRSKVGIMSTGDLSRLNPGSSSNLMFSKFKQRESVDLRSLFPFEFPCCPTITEPLSIRPKFCLGDPPWLASELFHSPVLGPSDLPDFLLPAARIVLGSGDSNAPQVSTHFLPGSRRPLHLDVASAIPEPAKPSGVDPLDLASITPVYPGESFENLSRHFLPAHDPESKEVCGLLLPVPDSMSNEAQLPPSGRPSRDDHRSDPQPPLPLAPKVQESPALSLSIPFQWVALITKSDSAAFTVDLAASTTLKKLTDPFRSCEISNLEVVLMPTPNAFNNPVTLHCVWTVNSIQPASGDELLYYGGQAITAGGPVSMNTPATVPADLTRINPRIKSSVGYLDTPRLTGTTMKCATAQTLPLAYVMTRGMVSVSGPMGIKL